MKLYKGKKRYAKRLLGPNRGLQTLIWALTVKVGDYIATCEGCNRKVAKIEIVRQNEGWFNRLRMNGTWVITEVCFTDTRGRFHYSPGGGCALPVETPEQVNAYLKESAEYHVSEAGQAQLKFWFGDEQKAEEAIERDRRILDAINSGRGAVDSFGEILPEFENQP